MVPRGLYRGICGLGRGRDDRRWFRTVNPESSVHNWPVAESVNKQTNQ